jgi:hypothetical protein
VAVRREGALEEAHDPGLILHDQNAHSGEYREQVR